MERTNVGIHNKEGGSSSKTIAVNSTGGSAVVCCGHPVLVYFFQLAQVVVCGRYLWLPVLLVIWCTFIFCPVVCFQRSLLNTEPENVDAVPIMWESQSTFTKAHVTGLPLFRVRIESQRSSMTCTKYFGFSLVAALKSRSSKLWSNCLAGCLKDCSRRSVTGTQLSCNDLLKQCKMWSAVTETLSFPDSYTFLPTVTFSVLLKHIVFLPGTSSAGT